MPTYTVILKLKAEDICQIEDGLVLRVIGFWGGNVCLDTVDLLICSLSGKGFVVSRCERDKMIMSELPSGVPS
jgi:hypothetical protein